MTAVVSKMNRYIARHGEELISTIAVLSFMGSTLFLFAVLSM